MPEPTFVSAERGVRTYIADYIMLCHVYDKYQLALALVLPEEVVAAMGVLCSFVATVRGLNHPGPG